MKETWLELAPKRGDLRVEYLEKLIRLLSAEVSVEILDRLAYRALPNGWLDRSDVRSNTSVWPLSGGRPGSKR